ncbi:hypothetical protein [Williamsia sterculiae]|uniref:Uncharacterized protein n=1 Tax=Williamsia sterculiae TaxID=1344003 RepID=A0A1N7GF62_9NOCA|nr:hypothetical protein [Williamsia sterculiae]SIS11265.1 hypothetical protein SAMN05445060_2718 [Williamsia sterculiae]
MSRLGRQSGSALVQTISDLQTATDEARSKNQPFGANTVRTYRLYNTTSNNDINLMNLTTSTPQCVEFTVTPKGKVLNPTIVFDFGFQYTTVSGTGTLYSTHAPLVPVNGVQKFRLYLIASPGASFPDLSIAASFWTISDGTYTVEQVAV